VQRARCSAAMSGPELLHEGAWIRMKTFSAKKEDVQRRWYLIDAEGKVLGRVASQVATILRGKHKPIYTPHMDTGDHVIVVNASRVKLTGNKRQEKFYAWHSGYPGGFKSIFADKLLAQKPERVIEIAVKGMLPKNKLGRAMFKKLKVYGGPNHPHQAQQPQPLASVKA
jgi:large subunit ribosomal protein L13